MTDAHQPPVTSIAFISSNLELAEKELTRAQEEVARWQAVVDSLKRARSDVAGKQLYMKPQKKIEMAVAWYRTRGQEAHISECARALKLTEKEMRSLSTQIGMKARTKTMFYRVKGKKATYGLLEWQK